MDPWETLCERELLATKTGLRVSKQSVRLPSGQVIDDYYQVTIPDYVTIHATTDDDAVLCLRQYKHGMRKVALTLPGGVIDPGEDPLQAAKRELLEETGTICAAWDCLGNYIVNGNQRMATAWLFRGTGACKVAEGNGADLEEMELCLINQSDMKDHVRSGQFPIVSHVAAIMLAKAFD